MNTHNGHFNLLARVLHWTMALMIIAMLFIGVTMVASLHLRPMLIDLHRPLGIAILLLVLVRLYNRLRHRVVCRAAQCAQLVGVCVVRHGADACGGGAVPFVGAAGWRVPGDGAREGLIGFAGCSR